MSCIDCTDNEEYITNWNLRIHYKKQGTYEPLKKPMAFATGTPFEISFALCAEWLTLQFRKERKTIQELFYLTMDSHKG